MFRSKRGAKVEYKDGKGIIETDGMQTIELDLSNKYVKKDSPKKDETEFTGEFHEIETDIPTEESLRESLTPQIREELFDEVKAEVEEQIRKKTIDDVKEDYNKKLNTVQEFYQKNWIRCCLIGRTRFYKE